MQNLSHWLIPILSGLALWIAGSPGPMQRWGFMVGAITQGLWFYASLNPWCPWLFVATIVYTVGWGRGVKNYWFLSEIEKNKKSATYDKIRECEQKSEGLSP